MMRSFRIVLGLWLQPDTLVYDVPSQSELPAPYVDHDTVDSVAIANFLTSFSQCGEPVTLRVPNDAVDQLTVHRRRAGALAGHMNCHDFGASLLEVASASSGPLIDVQSAWKTLHALPDRRRAPPPGLFLFLVEGELEAVSRWRKHLDELLSITDPKSGSGQMPKTLIKFFGEVFGVAYHSPCLLDTMAYAPVTSPGDGLGGSGKGRSFPGGALH